MLSVSRTAPLLALFLLPSCISHEAEYRTGSSRYQLGEVVQTDGQTAVYELNVDQVEAPAIRVVRSGEREVPDFGFKLVELDRSRAKDCGLRPYSGLLVQVVRKDSPADQAGVQVGDVVYKMGGADVYYQKRFSEAVAQLAEGQQVEFEMAHRSKPEERRKVLLGSKLVPRRFTEYESVPLVPSKPRQGSPVLGARLAAVPAEVARSIYGDEQERVVVVSVSLGSPAYLSGLRAGDLIHAVDGEEVPELEALVDLIRERGAAGKRMVFDVSRGPRDKHEGDVRLGHFTGRRKVYVPFVVSTEVDARSTEWSFGPWGLIANYDNDYNPTDAREPETSGRFSSLVGLIKCRWSPSGTRWRLLWFISF